MRSKGCFLFFFLFLNSFYTTTNPQEYSSAGPAAVYLITIAGMGTLSVPVAIVGTVAAGVMIYEFVTSHGGSREQVLQTITDFHRYVQNNKPKEATKETAKDSCVSSPAPKDPKKPDDEKEKKKREEEEFKKKHPHGRYEDASYHRGQQSGRKSPRPIDGQQALDESFLIEGQTRHRIAINNGEFVVLYETSPKVYHGHVRLWRELTVFMQRTLMRQGLTNLSGKILK